MSVHAGTILTVGGNNVIDRIQSAGLGDVRLPIETIREVGNRLVVDKIPGEPDFTFTLESLDVSSDLMAWLTGKTGAIASGSAPGSGDPVGTSYDWTTCGFTNIISPWKDATTGSAGTIQAGHIVPGYYPNRLRYRFGVTDNATQEVELGGGSFYYGGFAPVEQYGTGTGPFTTSDNTVHHRLGGVDGTTFRDVFGVIVDGVLQTAGVDYVVTGGNGSPAVITFQTGHVPGAGAAVRFCYFTAAAKAYPQTVHASAIVKPGAVRGRNIVIKINGTRLGGVQSFELEATIDGEVEREMGNDEIVGRTVNGTDVTGTIVVRSKDATAFLALLSSVTGVSTTEVIGFFNQNPVTLEVQIQNPKDPGSILKTLYVADAIFQVPGTPARVNTPTDFSITWDSRDGTFLEYKGAKP
jgi:hypothetical protein